MFKDDPKTTVSRFYRVEITANLFQEFSVLREWGLAGGKGRQMIKLCPDLMSASHEADKIREQNLRRGYLREQ